MQFGVLHLELEFICRQQQTFLNLANGGKTTLGFIMRALLRWGDFMAYIKFDITFVDVFFCENVTKRISRNPHIVNRTLLLVPLMLCSSFTHVEADESISPQR